MTLNSALIFFKTFLSQMPSKKNKLIIGKLNQQMVNHLLTTPSNYYKNPLKERTSYAGYLDAIHISWITPYLRILTENDIRLFTSSLNEKKQREIKSSLLLSNHLIPLKKEAQQYLQEQLFTKIRANQKELIPIECLPKHPLNILLELSEEELVECINLIGLTDVAYDLKHIINTAKRNQILASLSPRQQEFLKSLTYQKENIAFKRMELDKWNGDPLLLHKLILQRGMNRLAKALYGTTASLFWYITHKLDISYTPLLEQLYTDLKHPQGQALLIKQIADLSTLIQEKRL